MSRILWDTNSTTNGTSAKAVAVEYVASNGTTLQASVEREVIVSAGTIGSPKVLELSGVGNATYVLRLIFTGQCVDLTMACRILTAAGVQPVVNLSTVGENLAGVSHQYYGMKTN